MYRPGRLKLGGCLAAALVVGIAVCGFVPTDAWARRVKIDRDLVEKVEALCEDREAALADDAAMSTAEFQKAWSAFAEELNSQYEGQDVRIGKFGSHIRVRQQFTLLMYVALRSQIKGVDLEPSIQELIARHPFLQMLVTEGSCYIRNDRYPKKMSDFFEAYPQMPLMLRQHLDRWASDHRKAYEEAFPVKAANSME